MIGDDLDQRLSNLEEQAGVSMRGSPLVITYGCSSEYMVEYEPNSDDDPIDSYSEPALPNVWPPAYLSKPVVVLTSGEIMELWDTMPDDVREREREYRREHGLPLPPVLEE